MSPPAAGPPFCIRRRCRVKIACGMFGFARWLSLPAEKQSALRFSSLKAWGRARSGASARTRIAPRGERLFTQSAWHFHDEHASWRVPLRLLSLPASKGLFPSDGHHQGRSFRKKAFSPGAAQPSCIGNTLASAPTGIAERGSRASRKMRSRRSDPAA